MNVDHSPLNKISTLLLVLLALLTIATTLYVRIRLMGTPLERDEGEYAYMAQLLLKGIPPYTNAYTMKLPGVALCYALIMSVFGLNAAGIHIGLILVNFSCGGLLYLLGKRLFARETAIMAAVFFILLSLSESVFGVHAHATHFMLFFSLSGILLLEHALEKQLSPLIIIGGIGYGMAILMKQHAAILIIFALAFQVWPQRQGSWKLFLRNSSLFLSGAAGPYIAIALWVFTVGSFDRFWFWTVQYASTYAAGLPLAEGLDVLGQQVATLVRSNLPIWVLAGAGIVSLYTGTISRVHKRFLGGYLTISFIMICPGLYFRSHYFVLLLPPVALLAAYAATACTHHPANRTRKKYVEFVPIFLFAVAAVYPLVAERNYNFTLEPLEVSRRLYGTNVFPEAIPIADYLRSQTTSADRIAILGSEPEILFYADRLAATGHIYMYGLMENHRYAEKMQLQLISEIESTMPAFIVVVHNSASWALQINSSNKILDWGDSFIPLRYDEVGIIEIFGDSPTRYLWNDAAIGHAPETESFVSIYRRRW